jgi:hypothetical protein
VPVLVVLMVTVGMAEVVLVVGDIIPVDDNGVVLVRSVVVVVVGSTLVLSVVLVSM